MQNTTTMRRGHKIIRTTTRGCLGQTWLTNGTINRTGVGLRAIEVAWRGVKLSSKEQKTKPTMSIQVLWTHSCLVFACSSWVLPLFSLCFQVLSFSLSLCSSSISQHCKRKRERERERETVLALNIEPFEYKFLTLKLVGYWEDTASHTTNFLHPFSEQCNSTVKKTV